MRGFTCGCSTDAQGGDEAEDQLGHFDVLEVGWARVDRGRKCGCEGRRRDTDAVAEKLTNAGISRFHIRRLKLDVTMAFTRFRMGNHSLPCVTGRVASIHRAQRVCGLCQTENVGDEQQLVFESPALQGVRDRYNGHFGDCAAIMVQFMWQSCSYAIHHRMYRRTW